MAKNLCLSILAESVVLKQCSCLDLEHLPPLKRY